MAEGFRGELSSSKKVIRGASVTVASGLSLRSRRSSVVSTDLTEFESDVEHP